MPYQKTICAIIPTYNRIEVLKKSLQHVLAQSQPLSTIIIIDNNSTDGTREYLQLIENKDSIHCLYLDDNMGAGYAISKGMKYALSLKQYDYFWILDDDSFYGETVLEELISNIEQSDFSLLGLSGSKMRWGMKWKIKSGKKVQEADYVLVDGSVIKVDVIKKIGTTYERFFMMCDDDEYIMRLKRNGYKIGLLDLGPIDRLHLGGQGAFTKATLWRGYYSSRNQLLILKKYFSLQRLLGYLYLQLKLLIAAAIFAPDRYTRVKFRLLGIWHGIRGVDGKTLDPSTLSFCHKSNQVRSYNTVH